MSWAGQRWQQRRVASKEKGCGLKFSSWDLWSMMMSNEILSANHLKPRISSALAAVSLNK